MMGPNEKSTGTRPVSSATVKWDKWLGGWGWMVVCVLVIVGAILAVSGELDGKLPAGALLPLLFVLPCALMMFMCMKNMGGNQSGAHRSISRADVRKRDVEDQL